MLNSAQTKAHIQAHSLGRKKSEYNRASGVPSSGSGATTAEVDAAAREVIDRRGARSNFLGYHGFPAVICASPNEVVVHGIPGPRVLEEGEASGREALGALRDAFGAESLWVELQDHGLPEQPVVRQSLGPASVEVPPSEAQVPVVRTLMPAAAAPQALE